jgi:hypothetical protein
MTGKLSIYLLIAAGCWMVGEGLRMVVMGLFYKDHYYSPGLFDIFFDWLPMVVIGAFLLLAGIREFYVRRVEASAAEARTSGSRPRHN